MKKTLRCDARSLDTRPGHSLSLSGGYINIQLFCTLFGLYSFLPVSVTWYDTRIMAIYLALTIASDITKTARACESCQKALWNRQIEKLSFQLFRHIYYVCGWRGIYVFVKIFKILQVFIEINFLNFNIFSHLELQTRKPFPHLWGYHPLCSIRRRSGTDTSEYCI